MGSNSFGKHFQITTWGESHGPSIGVVIDGCPAGLPLSCEEIQHELDRRSPGRNPYTSPRKEKDQAEILSGIFEGKTTGSPIAIQIQNCDHDSSSYEPIKDLLRPGHANFTYLKKYGIFDHRGGGRSSGRETAARVAAGSIAKKLLFHHGIHLCAFLKEVGGISIPINSHFHELKSSVEKSPLFCSDPLFEEKIINEIEKVKEEGDSLGGIIECVALVPHSLGDPIYEKIEANLAKAMLSLPATKGIEFGCGFEAARMKGSTHNDLFYLNEESTALKTNHAGGTLGGITTGMPLVFRVAFKPTSSIKKPQETIDLTGEEKIFQLPQGSRHDPCIALRAPPVVEAMTAICLADSLLMNRLCRL